MWSYSMLSTRQSYFFTSLWSMEFCLLILEATLLNLIDVFNHLPTSWAHGRCLKLEHLQCGCHMSTIIVRLGWPSQNDSIMSSKLPLVGHGSLRILYLEPSSRHFGYLWKAIKLNCYNEGSLSLWLWQVGHKNFHLRERQEWFELET